MARRKQTKRVKKMEFVRVTHEVLSIIADEPDDKRTVTVKRAENGSYMIEWATCDFTNGNSSVTTKVVLSERAAMATVLCLADLFQRVDEDQPQ
jgi:hypothetical protein